MLYSKQLLSSWASLPSDYLTIKEQLIAKVFEIEHGETIRVLPDLLVVGKVDQVIKHPNADTLFVCQIDCGIHGSFQICTGGENIAAGQYVPTALPGCILPAIDLTIGSRTMRGEASNGMICSKGELGLHEDEDKHRIWDMSNDLSCDPSMIGRSMKECFPWLENIVFEVESVAITNRPDLRGHIGLAIESNAVFPTSGNLLSPIQQLIEKTHSFSYESIKMLPVYDNSLNIAIKTTKCTYYSLTYIEKTQCQPSVFLGRSSLIDLGHTPKLNWIDYSNYFMSLTGQPVHCFDRSLISGSIRVEEANGGEIFRDLSGKEHLLEQGDIIICDDDGILALGGIIGGSRAQVSESTSSIGIEIAHFDSLQVRKTATRLSVKTEAAIRYEKGINPLWTAYCTILGYELLTKNNDTHATGAVSSISSLLNDQSIFDQGSITFDISKASEYIRGENTPGLYDEFLSIIKKLGYSIKDIKEANGTIYQIIPPIRRSDVCIVEDIYEDLARHTGLEHIPEIPSPVYPSTSITSQIEMNYTLSARLIEGLGFTQVETYPWYGSMRLENLGVNGSTHSILFNPTDTTTPYMRQTIIPGLLQLAQKNYRITLPLKIVEIGKVYHTQDKQIDRAYIAQPTYITGLIATKQQSDRKQDSYLHIRKSVESIMQSSHIKEYELSKSNLPYLHPTKQAYIVVDGQQIGLLGEVHPSLLDKLGFQNECTVSIMEINNDILYKYFQGAIGSHSSGSYASNQDQLIVRDLCFEVSTDQSFDKIIDRFKKSDLIIGYEIIDLYHAPGSDKKSIALRFTLQGDGTLTIEGINSIMDRLIEEVQQTGAMLKGGR